MAQPINNNHQGDINFNNQESPGTTQGTIWPRTRGKLPAYETNVPNINT